MDGCTFGTICLLMHLCLSASPSALPKLAGLPGAPGTPAKGTRRRSSNSPPPPPFLWAPARAGPHPGCPTHTGPPPEKMVSRCIVAARRASSGPAAGHCSSAAAHRLRLLVSSSSVASCRATHGGTHPVRMGGRQGAQRGQRPGPLRRAPGPFQCAPMCLPTWPAHPMHHQPLVDGQGKEHSVHYQPGHARGQQLRDPKGRAGGAAAADHRHGGAEEGGGLDLRADKGVREGAGAVGWRLAPAAGAGAEVHAAWQQRLRGSAGLWRS